jgi:hypothetical protein
VGADNPIAMPGLARSGARRSEIFHADEKLSGSLNAEGFQNIRYTPGSRSSARLVRHFFSMLNAPPILSCLWVGHVLDAYLGGEEGTGGFELAAGVGAGDGQPGSNARARRSLATVEPCEFLVSPRGEARSYARRRRSQPEERHGLAEEVHMVHRR